MTETVTIRINDQERVVESGTRLIDALFDLGIRVPHFCYHRDLPEVGSCRMCQVEIEQAGPGGAMRKGLGIACRTRVAEGMVVWVDSEPAKAARKGVVEFQLKDHPLDCPICDKAGECSLQDFAYSEEQNESRSNDEKRSFGKRIDLGEVIVLDRERCVLCTRCVRTFTELEGKPQLQVLNMGNRSCIGTWKDEPLRGDYQGNVADVCPVGALTLKKFRFQARSWNLNPMPSTCTRCSRGCSVTVDGYRGEIVRIRPRRDPQVNRSWICDHGRFAFDDLNLDGRLSTGIAIDGDRAEEIGLDAAIARTRSWLSEAGSQAVLIASPYLTSEEGRALVALAEGVGTAARFVAPTVREGDGILRTGDPCPNRSGLTDVGLEPISPRSARELLEGAKASLLVGEKVLHFLHELSPTEASIQIPPTQAGERAACLDTHPREGFAICLPAASWVEKNGTTRNVDGLDRKLRMVMPPPAGTPPTEKLLRELASASDASVTATA